VVGETEAGVRGNADAGDLLNWVGAEIFRGLASVAAGDQKINACVETTIQKRPHQSATKFLHRKPVAFGIQVE
jgi:hypothetical protein